MKLSQKARLKKYFTKKRKKLEKKVTEFLTSDASQLDLLIYGTLIVRIDAKCNLKRVSPVDVFIKTTSI